MAAIAGLQDFRQEAPPADIGTFLMATEVLVFEHTFAGASYICAVRSGERGWVLIDYLPVAAANNVTVITAALNDLTAGRTWQEKVVVMGDFTINASIVVPSYVILEIHGILTMANGVNITMIDVGTQSNVTITGGILDGNRANNPGITFGISFYNVSESIIENVFIRDVYGYSIQVHTCNDIMIEKNICENSSDDGIAIVESEYISIIGNVSRNHTGGTISTVSSGIEINDNSRHIDIIGNICYGNLAATGNGIAVHWHAASTPVHDITIEGNVCYNNHYGIRVRRISGAGLNTGIVISNNSVDTSVAEGIRVEYSQVVTVQGNIVRNSSGAGIMMGGPDATTHNYVVKGNLVDGSGTEALQNGIEIRTDDGTINDNFVLNARRGISIIGTRTDLIVNGNFLRDNSRSGIRAENELHYSIISDI